MADLDHDVDGVGSTVLWDEEPAKAMFESIRADQPAPAPVKATPKATVEPELIRVAVRNGSGVTGLGARAARDLRAAGYAVSGKATNATSTDPAVTTVRYDDDYSESVKTLQAALPGATFVPVPRLGGTFEVTVGSSYDGVRPVKVSAPGPAVPAAAPARTAADDVCA
jgi:hypothetical protein